MLALFWGFTSFSVIGNVMYFFYEFYSRVFLMISVALFMTLLFMYGYKIKKKFNVNLIPFLVISLILMIFSLLPLYFSSAYFTYLFAQFLSFAFLMIYLRNILLIVKSKRTILGLLFLSIITFGIYPYFFFYHLTKEIQRI